MAWSKHRQAKASEQTEKRIASALSRIRESNSVLLARVQSKSRKSMKHEVRLGSNGAVYCTCEAWKYQHSGTCPHLERFRHECVAQDL